MVGYRFVLDRATVEQIEEEQQGATQAELNHAAGIITLPSGNPFYNDRYVREHQICRIIGDIAGTSRNRWWMRALSRMGAEAKALWPVGTEQDFSASSGYQGESRNKYVFGMRE
jgi:hypothetical protein